MMLLSAKSLDLTATLARHGSLANPHRWATGASFSHWLNRKVESIYRGWHICTISFQSPIFLSSSSSPMADILFLYFWPSSGVEVTSTWSWPVDFSLASSSAVTAKSALPFLMEFVVFLCEFRCSPVLFSPYVTYFICF